LARAGQDIGSIPPVVNPERRQQAIVPFPVIEFRDFS
jgi:hypothetical protein